MTQTALPPTSASTSSDTLATRAPREIVVHRVTLHGISWPLYEQLLTAVGEALPRMTYDRGTLELEMLSEDHEALNWIAGRFIEAYADELSINYRPVGSMTWRRQAIEGGLEPDEAYYFQNCAKVRGRKIDLETDPPPDLAVEIDLSPPEVEKASVYARLGVPEIWRWRGGRLVVLALQITGGYAEVQRSIALPDFPLEDLAAALGGFPQVDSTSAVAAFRRRLREKVPRE